MLLQRSLLFFAMILLSCGASFSQEKFTHHHKMTSEYVERDDMSFEPSYFFVEQSLDSLDFHVRVTPSKIKKKCTAMVGVSFWLNGENHADAVVFKKGAMVVIQMQYTINGKFMTGKYLYSTPSHYATIHIKRVDDEIVFGAWRFNKKLGKLNIKNLAPEGFPTGLKAQIVFYATHHENGDPFTVNFDY